MHFVAFQSSQLPSTVPTAQEYFGILAPLVKEVPGFIDFTFHTSPIESDLVRGMLVAQFKDEHSIRTWQQHPTHLDIQMKARANIFEDYRIRIGPELCAQVAIEGEEVKQVVLLMTKPETENNKNITDIKEFVDRKEWKKLRGNLLDQAVYHAEEEGKRIWLSSWKKRSAARKFVDAAGTDDGDEIHYFQVDRDYTRFKRRDAPKNNQSA